MNPVPSDAASDAENTPQKERVLLVEDNHVNQLVAKALIKKNGHTCDVAESGFQALEMIAKAPYPIIFMDLQMPGMSGFETVREIRSQSANTDTRPWIIALTADATEADKEKCLASGMNDYMCKPVQPKLLQEKLEYARTAVSET